MEVLQMWIVAANILNKRSRTPTKGGPPASGLNVGLVTPHRKIYLVMKGFKAPRT
jgi:hypothetical protein